MMRCFRIAGAASQRSKILFDLNIIFMLLWLSSESTHMKQSSTVTSLGVICEEASNTKADDNYPFAIERGIYRYESFHSLS